MVSVCRRLSLLVCALVTLGCQDKPTTGDLVVNINGLPAGAPAVVIVTGPGGFLKQVFATSTLENLAPGTYTVGVTNVHFSGAVYTSTVIYEPHTITAGQSETATVPYTLASGSLEIAVDGLPSGLSPALVLECTTCAGGYTRIITAPGVIGELDAGAYVLRADTVTSNAGDRFGASIYQQSINLQPSLTVVHASVSYALSSGSLVVTVSGLPQNQNPPPVTITGPGSFSRQTAVTTTFNGLNPGTYTISAVKANGTCPNYYTPAQPSQSVDVTIGATTPVTVGFAQSQVFGADLNLKVDQVHLVQVVQDYAGTTPMIAGKPALLRVFGLANQCNSAAPKVRVTITGGAPITIDAIESEVRQVPDQGVLVSSWNVPVAGNLVQPGMTVTAVIDPDNAVAEANEADNTLTKNIDVRTIAPVGIRFVSVVVAGNSGNVTAGRIDSLLDFARKIHPVSSFDADVRATPYTSSRAAFTATGGSWTEVLNELDAARIADSTNVSATGRYYVGMVHVTYNSGVAGIGFIGRNTSLSWDYASRTTPEIVAHELGHNYGRFHSPCGNPSGIDPAYPYAGGYIGQYGYDVNDLALRQPQFFTDVMGYCNNRWISDYTYKGMMQWLIDNPTSLPAVSNAAVQPSMLIWGRIVNGQPVLEPTFELNARPELPRASGQNRIVAADEAGAEIFSLAFAANRVADLPGNQETFAFAVPLSMLRGRTLASLRLIAAGTAVGNVAAADVASDAGTVVTRMGPRAVRVQWDASKFPVVMVRDPVRGEVLSFARGGDATIVTSGNEIELVYSNRLRSARVVKQLR